MHLPLNPLWFVQQLQQQYLHTLLDYVPTQLVVQTSSIGRSNSGVCNGKHLLDGGDQLVLDPTLVVGISGERKRSRAHCKFLEFDSDI